MVIPSFIGQALSDKEITVLGDGEQTRCFCHVKDVVWALANIIQCPEAMGRVITIGNDEEISINRLAQRVKEIIGSNSPIINIPYEEAYTEGSEDMVRRVPDLALAYQLIGFRPVRTLDDIILDVIQYAREKDAKGPSLKGRNKMGKRGGSLGITARSVN